MKKLFKSGAHGSEITTKRLGSKRKRRNQICATPDHLGSIQTPNVHDITPDVDNKPNNSFTPSSPSSPDHGTEDQASHKKEVKKDIGPKYECVAEIGHGAFGKVIKARALSTECKYDHYAIKLIPKVFRSNQMALRMIRELRILRILRHHEAIVELVDLVPPSDPFKFNNLSMVFEYMPTDLAQVFKSKQYFSNLHIKYIMYQLLLGINHIHSAGIVHRDLKPENIIINGECTVRICDFGLARGVQENIDGCPDKIQAKSTKYLDYDKEEKKALNDGDNDQKEAQHNAKEQRKKLPRSSKKLHRGLTRRVVSLWYRAPEVILWAQNRDTVYAIDIWSVGCIFGELLQMHHKNCHDYNHRNVLFPGKICFPFSDEGPTESQLRTAQLRLVFNLIGTPNEQELSTFKDKNVLKYLNNMQSTEATDLSQMYPVTKKEGVHLLRNMLQFSVSKRVSGKDALKSEYFAEVRDESAEKRINDQKVEKFEFEDIDVETKTLRALIVDEVMQYNPEWLKQEQ